MLRVREPVVLLDPESGGFIVPQPGERFAADHPLVIAHPWAFEEDGTSPIERATRRPGERRPTRRTP